MFIKKIVAAVRRQGLAATWQIIHMRIRKRYYRLRMRIMPLSRPKLAYEHLYHHVRSLPINKLLIVADATTLRAAADAYAADRLTVFGTTVQHLTPDIWHTDVCFKAADAHADTYFPPLPIDALCINFSTDGMQRVKDIKVPWELSRLQQLPVLAHAYAQLGTADYLHALERHLNHWITHNPYMHGVNWLCAMEVALRAINIVTALAMVAQTNAQMPHAWQQYVDNLYAHMEYINYHWEWYDGRTSNHYLADLVGYLYLCWLFKDLPGMQKKTDWTYTQVMQEMRKQVHAEGSDYEGSTTYHYLVLQLFEHVAVILELLGYTLPAWFHERLARMRTFARACMYAPDKLSMIGDCDSGSVLWPGFKFAHYAYNHELQQGIEQYPAFGLTVVRTQRMHFTLRHHAYQVQQPSGHFHNDVASITLAIDGIPVFIDPGSFVYTAWPYWRNRFRSAAMHTCMSIQDHEPTPFDTHLFSLRQPVAKASLAHGNQLTAEHTLYARFGLIAQRSITYGAQELCVRDIWISDNHDVASLTTYWCWLVHPDIRVEKINAHDWYLRYQDQRLCRMQTDYPLEIEQSYASLQYGQKIRTNALIGRQPLVHNSARYTRVTVDNLP